MKKKDIVEHLDNVGTALSHMKAMPKKDSGVSSKEANALLVGISFGVAFGAVLAEGNYEIDTPLGDAMRLVECAIETLARRKEECHG